MTFKRLFSLGTFTGLVLAMALCLPLTASASSGWLPVGSRGFSEGKAYEINLVLDSHNIPYVAYELDTFGHGTVMKYNGSANAWENVGPANFTAEAANYINLALDSKNTPYVAYE